MMRIPPNYQPSKCCSYCVHGKNDYDCETYCTKHDYDGFMDHVCDDFIERPGRS